MRTVLSQVGNTCHPSKYFQQAGRPFPGRLSTIPVKFACQADKEDSGSHTAASSAVEELLKNDPKTHERIERVRRAAQVVADLQAQRAEIDKAERDQNCAKAWESQDVEREQAQRASERGANADILSAADELERAQADLKMAAGEMSKWSTIVNEEAEKLESGKAALIGGLGALAGAVPLSLGASSPLLVSLSSIAISLITGVLFAVTYRYAVRQDTGNVQLKSGVLAAFGLARGLALAEGVLRDRDFSLETLGSAALCCGQSLIVLGFSALALDVAFQRQLVKPFGLASQNRE